MVDFVGLSGSLMLLACTGLSNTLTLFGAARVLVFFYRLWLRFAIDRFCERVFGVLEKSFFFLMRLFGAAALFFAAFTARHSVTPWTKHSTFFPLSNMKNQLGNTLVILLANNTSWNHVTSF